MNSKPVHITCPHCNAVNRMQTNGLAQHPKCGICHQPLFMGKPLDLTSGNFSKVINKTDIPVVVDFWATWCGPCKMMAPIFEQAASTIEPKARLAKLNTEAAQDVAATYNIRSIPTLVVFKNGRETTRQAGAMDHANLVRYIEAHI